MTLTELNEYFELVNKLKNTEELLLSLRAEAYPSSPRLTGMPHGTEIKDNVGDLAVSIADLEVRKKIIEDDIENHRKRIEAFVATIDDPYICTIFRLRFTCGRAWKDVARIVGGHNTEEGVKSACYRYLKRLAP